MSSMIAAVLNSNLFYWWFIINSDSRHLNNREIESFSISLDNIDDNLSKKFCQITNELMRDYESNKTRKQTFYKTSGKVIYDEYYPRKSKSIIDRIDKILAEHYGFTDEELDFIINYDIKCRMGRELREPKGNN